MKIINTRPGEYEITTTGQVAYEDNSGNWYEANWEGEIVVPELYVYANYSQTPNTITQIDSKTIEGIKNFTMRDLQSGVANCALVATTRVLDYYYNKNYKTPPKWYIDFRRWLNPNYTPVKMTESNIYWVIVKPIGEEYGFDPSNTGEWYSSFKNLKYNLYDYTYNDVKKIVRDSLEEMNIDAIVKQIDYIQTTRGSRFLGDRKIETQMKDEINNERPIIISNALGDYSCHTITGIGYETYYDEATKKNINLIQVYDGWSNSYRYIDWNSVQLSSVLFIVP